MVPVGHPWENYLGEEFLPLMKLSFGHSHRASLLADLVRYSHPSPSRYLFIPKPLLFLVLPFSSTYLLLFSPMVNLHSYLTTFHTGVAK